MVAISVIIPVYNAEPYLRRCLDGLLAQSFVDWEAICVDDGSKDASNSILQEYSVKDRRVIVIGQKNGGAAVARNTGLRKAQGDFVFFLDSDDELEPNCLAILWKEVRRHPDVEMVVGANKTINDKGISRIVTYGKPCYIESNEWVRYGFFKDENAFYMVPWNKLIKKSFLIENAIHFKEGVICEDEYWSFYLYRTLKNMAIIDNITYFHHVTSTSVMSTSGKQKQANALLAIINDLKKDFDSPLRSLQVYKYMELYRNCIHPNVSKAQSRPLYFGFFRQLLKLKQYRIAFYWLVNWIHDYKHYQLYYEMIPKAYRKEVERSATLYGVDLTCD